MTNVPLLHPILNKISCICISVTLKTWRVTFSINADVTVFFFSHSLFVLPFYFCLKSSLIHFSSAFDPLVNRMRATAEFEWLFPLLSHSQLPQRVSRESNSTRQVHVPCNEGIPRPQSTPTVQNCFALIQLMRSDVLLAVALRFGVLFSSVPRPTKRAKRLGRLDEPNAGRLFCERESRSERKKSRAKPRRE